MASKMSGARGKGKAKASATNRNVVPAVYQDMLAETLSLQSDMPERPLKKRRTGRRDESAPASSAAKPPNPVSNDEEEDIEFEDVFQPSKLGALDGSESDSS